MRDLPVFANFGPVLCLATGLFRSLRRGTRTRPLDLTWRKGGEASADRPGEVFRFRSEVLLGADDLRVLQGVLAFVDPERGRIGPERRGSLARLRSRLRLEGDAEDGDAYLVQLGFSELARTVGYGGRAGREVSGGGIAEKVRCSMDRLAGLSVSWEASDVSASWQLLSWDDDGPRGRKLRVALNPRLASCAIGTPPYARVDLAVARGLRSDPARLMHQRLSAWIGRAKEPRRVRVDTLAKYAWSTEDTGPSCLRKRRWRVDDVVTELREAGWDIGWVAGSAGLLLVSGPPKAPPAAQQHGEGSGQEAACTLPTAVDFGSTPTDAPSPLAAPDAPSRVREHGGPDQVPLGSRRDARRSGVRERATPTRRGGGRAARAGTARADLDVCQTTRGPEAPRAPGCPSSR